MVHFWVLVLDWVSFLLLSRAFKLTIYSTMVFLLRFGTGINVICKLEHLIV